MKTVFTSTFSTGMIARESRLAGVSVSVKEVSLAQAKFLAIDAKSAVGHPASAQLMSKLLEVDMPSERVALSLRPEDGVSLVVFQLDQSMFRRLNEGEVLDAAAMEAAMEAGALSWLLVTLG